MAKIVRFIQTAKPGHYTRKETGVARTVTIVSAHNTGPQYGRMAFVHEVNQPNAKKIAGIVKELRKTQKIVEGEKVQTVAALKVGQKRRPVSVNAGSVKTACYEHTVAQALQGEYVEAFMAISAYKREAPDSHKDVENAGDTRAYLFQTLAEGHGRSFLRAQSGPDGAIKSLQFASQMAEGLAYIHKRGFVHGDVKPSNVLRIPGKGVKITDYDTTRTVAKMKGERRGGTRNYRAPEVIKSGHTQASDVYALAASLKEHMVALKAENFSDPHLFQSIEGLSMLATSEDPGQRPTAREVKILFDAFIQRELMMRLAPPADDSFLK